MGGDSVFLNPGTVERGAVATIELSAALALTASVAIGVNTIAVQRGLARVDADHGTPPIFAAAIIGLIVTFLIFWTAALARGIPPLTLRAVAPFLLAGVLYPALFRLLYYVGLDRIGANITGAIVAANPAIATFLAIPLLGERFTVATAAGLACIVGGGGILQLAKPASDDTLPTDAILRELTGASARDIAYPIAAMTTIAIGYILIKWGLLRFPHPVTATAVTQTAAIFIFGGGLVASSTFREQLRTTTSHRIGLTFFIGAGIAAAVTWLAQFIALQLGTVVVVVPLVNTYPLVIAALTYALARDLPRSPRVLLGIIAIVIGATVMQLG